MRIHFDTASWEQIANMVGRKPNNVRRKAQKLRLYRRGPHEQARMRKQSIDHARTALLLQSADDLKEYL